MRWRDIFVGSLWLAATIGSVQAQQSEKARLAIVLPSGELGEMTEAGGGPYARAFFRELRRLGFVEGKNLEIGRYSGEGRPERYPELARKVVGSNPDLIFTFTSSLVQAFQAATSTIPIVGMTADPVADGLVTSLARPGGNVTGVTADAGLEIWGKRLEILREAVPAASRVAFLAPLSTWEMRQGEAVREAARRAGVSLLRRPLESPIREEELRRFFATLAQEHPDALIVGDNAALYRYHRLIAVLAGERRLPTIYPDRDPVEHGGLMAYVPDVLDLFGQAVGQIARILKGVPPGEIPFYQSTKFHLIISMRTARSLGIEIPPRSLLARADEVIE